MSKSFNYGDSDRSLEKLNTDIHWNKKYQEDLKNRIITDIEHTDLQNKSENRFSINTHNFSLGRRVTYSMMALMVLVGLIIGSSFISPAMAEVVSKIPYLNRLFHSEPVIVKLMDHLRNEGYQIASVSSSGNKVMEIYVDGTEEYVQGVSKDIENIAIETLKTNGVDAYTVKVVQNEMGELEQPSPKAQESYEEANRINQSLIHELNKQDYPDVTTQVGTSDDSGEWVLHIVIGIPTTEEQPEKIKSIVETVLKQETEKEFTLKYTSINLKVREQENRWGSVITTMIDGLYSKKEFKVNGFSYSAHPQPMTLSIKTTISSSNSESKQLGMKIEETVKEFLESDDVKKVIGDDKYQINVYSKDKKKIN
ncbi:DUF4030 domain-containing protein [Bacillus sp. PS06]|uniref:DUF4030 domain-containing protein n=1 Tax=Bacillus sp. PS06 TaxID=2764176 RepID=UPI00177C0F5C|nr:DUF4030 domain-containing protein [Bacillus sp. PS06]MBD8069110.1 DUF4030 domain-containing protein [Bacillus sp. PS06]